MLSGMRITFDEKNLTSIAQKHALRFVILHGSTARGRTRSDSDVDVAVVGTGPIDLKTQVRLAADLGSVFGGASARELDVKTLDRVDPLFRHEVVRDGQLLYGDPTQYEEFKAFARRAYDDARSLLDLERTLSRKFQQHLNTLVGRFQRARPSHAQ